MNTRVMNILSAKDMVRVMTAYIDSFSKDFTPCKEEFEHAIHILRREVGDENPLALFVLMLSKAHLTSHSRMSGSR